MSKFNWKKGALHAHTLWSDGSSLPEIAIQTFKNCGFDFVCLTDHNIFQNDPRITLTLQAKNDSWPPTITWDELQRSQTMLEDVTKAELRGVRWFVNLKTFDELHKQFNKEGEFLLLPGVEITGIREQGPNGERFDVHANIINIPETLLPVPGNNDSDIYRADYQNYLKAAARHPDLESLFILDHPYWRLWDVSPMAALDNPEIRFFEIFNTTGEVAPTEETFTNDQFWDFVLAHRLDRNQPLLYGLATDDSHVYAPDDNYQFGDCNHGWVMVNCTRGFTPNGIIQSMNAADFYATNGVLLDEVDFDTTTRTLHVKIHPEGNAKYHIDFITTKKNFDRTIQEKEYPNPNPEFNRKLPIIPPSIGTIAQTTKGTEASYILKDDDLYVRAVAISDIPHEFAGKLFVPDTKRAWTQPFTK